MARNFASGLCLAAVLAIGPTVAHAAVGRISCASSAGTTLSAEVSYYDLGLVSPINVGSQSSGAGAGKVTFNPLEIHVSLDDFRQFFALATQGRGFESCALTSHVGASRIRYDFKLLELLSVDAVAGAATDDSGAKAGVPSAYTDVKFSYGAVRIQTDNGR